MAMPTRKLYWITAAIFFMVVILSYHKNSIVPYPQEQEQAPSTKAPVTDTDRQTHGQTPDSGYHNNINNDDNNVDTQGNNIFTPTADAPNTSGHYDTLVVIPSSWTQMQNRKWVRETVFGIKNNLEPCKKHDGKIIYKFYIHGRSTWDKTQLHTAQFMQAQVRELYAEFMEFDDSLFTNKTVPERHAVWGEALNWAVNTFVPQENIKVDKVLIFDSTTIVNLPKLEMAARAATSVQGYVYTWGEAVPFAAMMSFNVLDNILKTQASIKQKFPTLNLVEAAIQFYSTAPSTFKVLSGAGQIWASDIDQVATATSVVGMVYQFEDWTPIAQKLIIQPTAACATDKDRKSNIALLTSSYIYVDMCMAEASLPSAENKRTYARKHGYDFVARGAEFAQEEFRGRRPVWGKIGAIQKTLPHYEWLFWMDMDAVIADMDKDLRQIIKMAEEKGEQEDTEISLIVARPARDKMLNAGVMLIKNTDWSRRFFNEVQTKRDWFHKSSYEQAAIWEGMHDPKWSSGVYLFDGDDHTMNTFPKFYKEGDFVVHFAPDGCPAVPVLSALDKIAKGESVLGVGI